jgi:WD40 repeat protein
MPARRAIVFVLACLASLSGDQSTGQPISFPPRSLFLVAPPTPRELPEGALARLGPNCPRRADAVEALAFSPDGKTLVSAHHDHTLRVWDVAKRTERARFTGPEREVISLAFAPDGKTVLAAWSTGASLWTVPGGARKAKLGAKGSRLHHAAFTRDGRALAWLEDKRRVLHLWDMSTGRLVRKFSGHTGSVVAIALAPDGKRFASSDEEGAVRLWDLDTGKEVRRQDGAREQAFGEKKRYLARQLLFTPNGRSLYATGEHGECWWDLILGAEVESFERKPSDDEAHAVEMVVSFEDQEERGGKREAKRGARRPMAFTADRQVLVYATDGPYPWIGYQGMGTSGWLARGAAIPTGAITALVFAPGDTALASGDSAGAILLWGSAEALWGRRELRALYQNEGEDLWAALAADNPREAYYARWYLVLASDQGVALLQKKVRRARVVPAEQVRKLSAALDDDRVEVRRNAFAELLLLGPEAAPALRSALRDGPTAELAHKAELLQKAWATRQAAQALLILEQINTPRARDVLMDLAAGKADAPLTQGALAALHRLKGRPVAAPLVGPKGEAPAAGLTAELTLSPPGPGKPPAPGKDLSGNPLPKGTIARIGTAKPRDENSRAPEPRAQACLSPDGKTLLSPRRRRCAVLGNGNRPATAHALVERSVAVPHGSHPRRQGPRLRGTGRTGATGAGRAGHSERGVTVERPSARRLDLVSCGRPGR